MAILPYMCDRLMKKSASQPQAEAAYGAPVCRAALEDCFRRCADFSSRRLRVGAEGRIELFVCWIDGMISASEAAEDVLRPLTDPLRAAADADAERKRVCAAMLEGITDLATALPEHRVVPYPNIRKKDYPRNTDVKPVRRAES